MKPRILLFVGVIATLMPVAALGQSWQNESPYGAKPAPPLATTIAWPIANRSFERGEVLTEQDFVTQPLPARATVGLLPIDALMGKVASRAIPSGSALRQADIMEPQLVYRGAPVRVHVRIEGIDIASSGRALGDGQYGKSVRVFSNVSSRTLNAVVIGPGVVQLVF